MEKQRNMLQRELDELVERLDEAGGATQAQVRKVFIYLCMYRERGAFFKEK